MLRRTLHLVAMMLLVVCSGIVPGVTLAQSSGTTFTSPTYGYTLTYDTSWTVPAKGPAHDADTVILTNGVSTAAVTARQAGTTIAEPCLSDARDKLTKNTAVSNLQSVSGPASGDTTQAASFDTLTLTPAGGAPVDLALHLQCNVVPGNDEAIVLEAIAPQDADATQGPAITALFASLHVSTSPISVSSKPVGIVTPLPLDTLLPLTVGAKLAVTSDGVNLRAQPSTSAQVVSVLPAGAPLTVTGPELSADGYTWSPVKTTDGATGYVASQLVGSATAASATNESATTSGAATQTQAPAAAQSQSSASSTTAESPASASTTTAESPNGCYYTNVNGNQVPCPQSAPAAPAGATARCNDGTYSFSQNHSGTCSHHGGVAEWLQ